MGFLRHLTSLAGGQLSLSLRSPTDQLAHPFGGDDFQRFRLRQIRCEQLSHAITQPLDGLVL